MSDDSGTRHFLSVFAEQAPDRAAVVMAESGERLTYRELDELSNRIAHRLYASGLRRGDHLAAMIENSPIFFGLAWAALRSGLYFTPVNTRLTADEVTYIVEDCGAKTFVISSRFSDVGAGVLLSRPRGVDRFFGVCGAVAGYEALEEGLSALPHTPLTTQSDGATMFYSSGTTGRPKGIKRSLPVGPSGSLDIFTEKLAQLYSFDEATRYLCPTPIYHGAGFAYTTMMHKLGGSAVVMKSFTPNGFLGAIERHQITHAQVVPTIFVRLLKLSPLERRRSDLSSLRVLIHAAAPCPIPVKEQMMDWLGPIVYEYFAATEANGYTYISPQDWLSHKGSVGRAVIGTPHVVNERGDELPPEEPGMIYFEGLVPFEYHNDANRTAESRHPHGWTTTGDIGYLSKDGFLYLTDRKAFTIISGGVNIYPQEIENLLVTHPQVMDAAVFGIPDPEFQEQVKAVVQPVVMSDIGPALERELIAFCQANLARYKCPKSIDFLQELPRLENGKLYKRLLRDRYWGTHTTRIV